MRKRAKLWGSVRQLFKPKALSCLCVGSVTQGTKCCAYLGEGAGWVLCDLSCATGGKTVKNCPWMVFVADERGGGFHLFCELWEGKDQAFS